MIASYALVFAACGVTASNARRLRHQAHMSAASDTVSWPCVMFHKFSRGVSVLSPDKLAKMDKLTLWLKTSTRDFCVEAGNGPSKVDILWMDGSKKKGHIQLDEVSAVPEDECRGHANCVIFKGADPTNGGKPVAVKAWPVAEGRDAIRTLASAIDHNGSKDLIQGMLKVDILLSGFYSTKTTKCLNTLPLFHSANEIEGAAATELYSVFLAGHADTHIEDVIFTMLQKMSSLVDEVDEAMLQHPNLVSLQITKTDLNLRMAALTAALEDPDDMTACQGIFNMYIKSSSTGTTATAGSYPVNIGKKFRPESADQFCGLNNQSVRKNIIVALERTFTTNWITCPQGSAMGTFLHDA